MKRLKTLIRFIVPMFVAFLLSVGSADAASAWFTGAWRIVPSPNVNGSSSVLNGVAAVSKNDAWAVGQASSLSTGNSGTLTEHWNGTSWSTVKSPSPGTRVNLLNAVTAIKSNDVWAVGSFTNTGSHTQTLIEHWNGHEWSIVPSPNVLTSDNRLQGVAAVSARDVWAVGSYFNTNSGTLQTLIEHWNGHQWSLFFTMNPPGGNNSLTSVTAVSRNNAWAVGITTDPLTDHSRTLIEHWNGTEWRAVPSQNPGTVVNQLAGVSAASAQDIWAVGFYSNSFGGAVLTLVEHWNGRQWSVVASPNANMTSNHLVAVSVVSAKDVWAVGNSIKSDGNSRTLIEHWNGSVWQVVSSPNKGTSNNFLRGVTQIPRTHGAWAVGFFFSSAGGDKTLTELFSS